MTLIDKQFLETSFYGSRKMTSHLRRLGHRVNRKRVRRLMRVMLLIPVYPKPNLSKRNQEHKVYPYLLRNLEISRPNQVWATDITYIPMAEGHAYLTAVIDWYSRKVLSWRVSTTLETTFCKEALKEALDKYGAPEIFNTDQGCQYTSKEFTEILVSNGIKISMDSKGRALDNIIIERFWGSLKREKIYLNEYDSVKDLRIDIKRYISFYNSKRPHQSLNDYYPGEVYQQGRINEVAPWAKTTQVA